MSDKILGTVLSALSDADVKEVLAKTARQKYNHGPKTYFDLPTFPGDDTPKFSTKVGKMLMGRFTRNHQERLERLGYSTEVHRVVVVKNGEEQQLPFLYIFHEGFVDKVNVDDLPKLAKGRKMLHYKSKVVFNDGTYAWGIPACKRMESWSALMANPVEDVEEIIDIRASEKTTDAE